MSRNKAVSQTETTELRLLGTGRAFQDELITLLTGVELLSDFDGTDLQTLARFVQAYEAQPGCVIFREGEPGHYMCLQVSGRVKTLKESGYAHYAEVANEARGRSFGEMALIDGEPRSATCIATETSILLLLSKASFERLCEERASLGLKLVMRIAKLMSRRLRLTSGRLVDYLDSEPMARH